MIRFVLIRSLVAVLAFAVVSAHAADDEDNDDSPREEIGKVLNPGTRKPKPDVDPASNEALQALSLMRLPAGLEAKLWAAEPLLANPVAFNFDEKGRVFVAETYRYRTSVLDIRDYMWMVEDDLASRTIEDRTAMVQRRLGAKGMKELSIEGEVLRLVEDTDGDGVADRSNVYADGFNGMLDGIASGVLARRGDVYFTNIPSLWKFTGAQRAETRTELSRGYGVRFNFTGHDLHGLILGPDGKLYFSNGDRGATVKTQEGGTITLPDCGGVFRCNLDGSQLELVAWGLRNPQSLLFTENGDLFTGENDCDHGDEERLVHIVEGGDSGWRVGYQYAPLGRAGPWITEKMWQPRHEGQAAFFLPPLCNVQDGPSGIEYYPGTGLNSSYLGNIFIAHFKGAIATSGIYTYKLQQEGASYTIEDAKPFLLNALPTDVRFGPDGRLYWSNWGEGWLKSRRGRIFTVSDPAHADDPILKLTQQLIGSDWTKTPADELVHLLAFPNWRVRLEAQFALAERTDAAGVSLGLPRFASVATTASGNPLARRHAIWGLGQIAAKNREALTPLRALVRDADSEVRAQVIKVLGDHARTEFADTFLAALNDDHARVKFFAGQSLSKLARISPDLAPRIAPAVFAALRANDDRDLYLRHACVLALAASKDAAALSAGITDKSRAVRLGTLLALRRMGHADVQKFLVDSDPYLVREAALAINDEPINAALPALAALLDRNNTSTAADVSNDVPALMRAINAHFRLGQPANAKALAAYAARASAPEKLRAEALAQLALWPAPPPRDRIVGVYRPHSVATRDRAVATDALTPVLADILASTTPSAVQIAALLAQENLEIAGASDTLFRVIGDENQSGETRTAALSALDKIKDSRLPEAIRIAGASRSSELRLAALPLAARLSPEASAPVLANLVAQGDIAQQKAAFRALGRLKHPSADTLLAAKLRALEAGQVDPAVELELVNAASRRDDATIKNLLAQREAKLASTNDPLAPYRVALTGGNPRLGRQVFTNQPTLACIRCHRTGGEGGDAGPDLAEIGAKYSREYLLESIVKPNAKIAPGFDTIVLTLKSGGIAAGIVASETDDTITLRNVDNKLVEVQKSNIAKREGAPSSMPEIYGAILSKTELRDVVEYLATLKEKPARTIDTHELRALRHLPRSVKTE